MFYLVFIVFWWVRWCWICTILFYSSKIIVPFEVSQPPLVIVASCCKITGLNFNYNRVAHLRKCKTFRKPGVHRFQLHFLRPLWCPWLGEWPAPKVIPLLTMFKKRQKRRESSSTCLRSKDFFFPNNQKLVKPLKTSLQVPSEWSAGASTSILWNTIFFQAK